MTIPTVDQAFPSVARARGNPPPAAPMVALDAALGVNSDALRLAFQHATDSREIAAITDLIAAKRAIAALESHLVSALRSGKTPKTWAQIAQLLGVTPQAAHKRFRTLPSN